MPDDMKRRMGSGGMGGMRKSSPMSAMRPKMKGGEPPNRTYSGNGRKPLPKEGATRTMKIMTNPPKTVRQVYRNGQWVTMPGSAPSKAPKPEKKPMPRRNPKGMELGDAIKSMQGRKPWN